MEDVFSNDDEILESLNIQPYMFEPQVRISNDPIAPESSDESDDKIGDNDQIDRCANTIITL